MMNFIVSKVVGDSFLIQFAVTRGYVSLELCN